LSTAAPQLVLIAVWENSSGSTDVGERRPAPMSSTIRKLEDLPSDGGRTVDTLEKQAGPKRPSCGHDSVEPQGQGVGRRPYSCRLYDDAQRKCVFGQRDQREIDRLRRECLGDGGRIPIGPRQYGGSFFVRHFATRPSAQRGRSAETLRF
jgi:hypothetical protein